MPADFGGDAKADLAVFRPATAEWLTAIRATGRRADLVLLRPGTVHWLSVLSGGGILIATFGATDLAHLPLEAPLGA